MASFWSPAIALARSTGWENMAATDYGRSHPDHGVDLVATRSRERLRLDAGLYDVRRRATASLTLKTKMSRQNYEARLGLGIYPPSPALQFNEPL